MTLTPLDETKIIQNVKLDLEITDKLQDGLLKMLLDMACLTLTTPILLSLRIVLSSDLIDVVQKGHSQKV